MEKTSQGDCPCANEPGAAPSFHCRGGGASGARTWRIPLKFSWSILSLAILVGGCGTEASKPSPQAETKPAEPAIPEEIDLAKNGRQEVLAANVVPKTPTNNLPGTIVTRAVVAENVDGKWAEVFRCD